MKMKKGMFLALTLLLLVASVAFLGRAKADERHGGWFDTIEVSQVAREDAVSALQNDLIDFYGDPIRNPEDRAGIEGDPNLKAVSSTAVFYEITLNPAGPQFNDGRLNPFWDARAREALNWLIDRDYIVSHFMQGGGIPLFVPLTAGGPDYKRYSDKILALEQYYRPDIARADSAISQVMADLGAEKDDDGKWVYNGDPVTLKFLIRNDDEVRTQTGDYLANSLEDLGFTVERIYGSASELGTYWIQSDPADGEWSLYTGAWGSSVDVERDEGWMFGFFYTDLGLDLPLWHAYHPSQEFYDTAHALYFREYNSWDERDALFRDALEMALQDSARVFVATTVWPEPMKANILGAISDTQGMLTNVWPYTLRNSDSVGGTLRWGQSAVLMGPWNPIAGSVWFYDSRIQIATSDTALLKNPITGLAMPQRVASASVLAKTGLPIQNSSDWVTLNFADEIPVPDDAWVDWDATNQQFLTAQQVYPDGTTAMLKSTVVYPADLFEKVKWHDGSPLSVADFVMKMIMTYDRTKQESPIYDENAVLPAGLKAIRITSVNPLTIETYWDTYHLDAENSVTTWWPEYDTGPGAWHVLALSNEAEADGKLAYSDSKQSQYGQTDYVLGDSLSILQQYLQSALTTPYVPYAPTLDNYLAEGEAAQRYQNLDNWYQAHHHFWIGTGPYYLDSVDPDNNALTLKNFTDFPDPVDKWVNGGLSGTVVSGLEREGAQFADSGEEASFVVHFSVPVGNVDESDIGLVTSGDLQGVSIESVTPLGNEVDGTANEYKVTVNLGSGSGALSLVVPESATVEDSNGHSLENLPYVLGEGVHVKQGQTFFDVPPSQWAWSWIERLQDSGITAGCGDGNYCPDDTVTRAQMAVFLERGIHGSDYAPPDVGHSQFNDVPDDFWAKNWIEALTNDGVTTGCGNGNFCPDGNVTRAQMAVFLIRAEHGSDYTPPHVEHSRFNDIPDDFWAKDWIEQLAEEGITSGCGGGNYCPDASVTRAQMAVFLAKTFHLP